MKPYITFVPQQIGLLLLKDKFYMPKESYRKRFVAMATEIRTISITVSIYPVST